MIAFQCSAPFGSNDVTEGWPVVLCRNLQAAGIISVIDNELAVLSDTVNNGSGPVRPMYDYNRNGPGLSFIVLNFTGSGARMWDYIGEANPELLSTYPIEPPLLDRLELEDPSLYTYNGEWLSIPFNDPEISMSLSLCFANFESADTFVHVFSPAYSTEPIPGWTNSSTSYDTLPVRRQLGATKAKLTPPERGIFSLEPPEYWGVSGWYNETERLPTFSSSYALSDYIISYTQIAMCLYCYQDLNSSYGQANAAYSGVFQDILQETGHPALAIQAHIATLIGNAYYQYASLFDYSSPMNRTDFVEALVPTHWKGLALIVSMTAVYMLATAATVVVFAIRGDNTLVGSAWATCAQLMGEEIQEWAKSANGLRDAEVAGQMRRTGAVNQFTGLEDDTTQLRVNRKTK